MLAEEARAHAVRTTFVSLVEEHIVNEKPIDSARLVRLIDSCWREENISTPISVHEVVEKAEINILSSPYLDFAQKQKYKTIFDGIYREYNSRKFTPFDEEPYADLANELAKSVQEGKTSEALEQIRRIVTAYQHDLEALAKESQREPEFIDFLNRVIREPLYIKIFATTYLVLILTFLLYRRSIRKLAARANSTSPSTPAPSTPAPSTPALSTPAPLE